MTFLRIAAAALVVLTWGATAVRAQDVCAGGCPFATIQAAVDAATAGATVTVGPGTYGENVRIQKNLTLLSTGGREVTTIEGISGAGALGTVVVAGTTSGVQIGAAGQGFTIVGIDNGLPGIENAALYFQGNHANAVVRGNEIVANGDIGLLTEYGATISGFVIDGNVFSGQTFTGPSPAGSGFGQQFTLANVPRQLVVMGNGGGDLGTAKATNVMFTNNEVTGTAGGLNASSQEQGNTLVTLDVAGSTIAGNTFAGTTTLFGAALRVRRPGTTISGNTFASTGMSATTSLLFVQNNTTPLQGIVAANTFDRGVYVDGGTTVGLSVQAAATAAPAGTTIRLLDGTYTEQVIIDKDLTLQGEGPATVIQAPVTLATCFTATTAKKPVVCVTSGAEATVADLTVDGAGRGNGNVQFVGIAFRNAGGTVRDAAILDVRQTPLNGNQHGVGLYSYNDDGVARAIAVHDNTFSGFQKNAIALIASDTTPLSVDVRRNTITGAGPTTVIAQNGIQVQGRATSGTVADNTVSGIAYDNTNNPTKWVATSILNYYAALDVTGNTVTGGHAAIYHYDGSGTIGGNDLTVAKVGVAAWGIIASDPPHAIPSPFGDVDPPAARPEAPAARVAGVAKAAAVLGVEVVDNVVTFAGGDATGTHGIETDAGYGDDDLDFSASGNVVSGFEVGVGVYACEVDCAAGVFTRAELRENDLSGNTVALASNVGYLTVDASANWFGSADPAAVAALIDADPAVDFTPLLASGDDADAGTDGFQGDFFALVVHALGAQVGAGRVDEGVDLLDAGGVLDVAAGTYTGTAVVDKALTMQGEAAAAPGAAPLSVLDGGGSGNLVTLQASDVAFRDLTIQNAAQGLRFDWSGQTIDGVAIDNVHFLANTSRGVEIESGTTVTGLAISGSVFDNPGAVGLRMASGSAVDGLTLAGNTFRNNAYGVYQANDGGTSTLRDLHVDGGAFEDNTSYGLYAEELFGAVIEDAVFAGNGTGINLFKHYTTSGQAAGDVTIRGNTFTDHARAAVLVYVKNSALAGEVAVTGNTFAQNVGALADERGLIDVRLDAAFAHGAVVVAENTATLSGTFAGGAGATAAHVVHLRGGLTDVSVTANTFDGGGVGTAGGAPPTSGVYLQSNDPAGTFGVGAIPASAVVDVRHNEINGFVHGVTVYDPVAGTAGNLASGATVRVEDNDLSGNTFGVYNAGTSQTIDAENNWWGDAAGPVFAAAKTAAGVQVSANVDYDPWLALGDDLEPGTPGFQGTRTLSGRVTRDGDPLEGVTVTLTGSVAAETTTAADGTYAFAELPTGGNFVVAPALDGYDFLPAQISITNLLFAQVANFAAAPAGEGVDAVAVVAHTEVVTALGGVVETEIVRGAATFQASVEIPAGALDAPVPIQIGVFEPPPPGVELAGLLFFFGPSGTQFDVPVRVCIEYDENDLPAGVDAEDELRLLMFDETTGTFDVVDAVIDTDANTLCGFVDHFSGFGGGPPGDHSLAFSPTSAVVELGDEVALELTITNEDVAPSTDVEVTLATAGQVILGVTAPGGTSYDVGTGVWTVGALAGGESKTLQVVARPLAVGVQSVTATLTGAGGPELNAANDVAVAELHTEPDQSFWRSTNREAGTVTAFAAFENAPKAGAGLTLFAGMDGGGVWRSLDGGDNWYPADGSLGDAHVRALVTSGTALYAATYGLGIWRSTDDGANFTRVFGTAEGDPADEVLAAAAAPNGLVLAGTEFDGLFQSTTGNAGSWAAVPGLPAATIRTIFVEPNGGGAGVARVWVGLHGRGVYYQDLAGPTLGGVWTAALGGTTLARAVVHALAVAPSATGTGAVFAGTNEGVYRSTDDGATWTLVRGHPTDATRPFPVRSLIVFTDPASTTTYVTAGTDGYYTWRAPLASAGSPAAWLLKTGAPATPGVISGLRDATVLTLFFAQGYLFAGTEDHGIHRSDDAGQTFDQVAGGELNAVIQAMAFSTDGTRLFAGTQGFGLLYSDDFSGSTFVNWSRINNGLTNHWIYALAVRGLSPGVDQVFAGTWGNGVFRSNDFGESWLHVGLEGRIVRDLTVAATGAVYAALDNGTVARTVDGGYTWQSLGVAQTAISALAVDPANPLVLYAGTLGQGVYRTADGGISWGPAGLDGRQVFDLVAGDHPDAATGQALFAATSAGVFYSTDAGATWTAFNTGLSVVDVRALALTGGNLLAGTWGDGVFVYDDNATAGTADDFWQRDGLEEMPVVAFAVAPVGEAAGEVFTSTESAGLFRKPFAPASPTASEPDAEVPTDYVLEAAYPNPFNPTTTIRFGLPEAGPVRLEVYDVMGRRVRVLVDATLAAGTHQATFDAADLASGLYFYRLQAGPATLGGRVVLMK